MIVETLLNDFSWSEDCIKCDDPGKAFVVYNFLRELLLDSHLYVTKVVGFHIKNKTQRSHAGTYIARNVQMGDSYSEMVVKLSELLFLNSSSPSLTIPLKCGAIKASECTLPEGVKMLYVNDDLGRVVTGNCSLVLQLQTNCGYRSMQENSATLQSEYFPMNTYFNIFSYVRVLPMLYGGTCIKLRFSNGMTMEILKRLIVNYLELIKQEAIHEEELTWLHSFVL